MCERSENKQGRSGDVRLRGAAAQQAQETERRERGRECEGECDVQEEREKKAAERGKNDKGNV